MSWVGKKVILKEKHDERRKLYTREQDSEPDFARGGKDIVKGVCIGEYEGHYTISLPTGVALDYGKTQWDIEELP